MDPHSLTPMPSLCIIIYTRTVIYIEIRAYFFGHRRIVVYIFTQSYYSSEDFKNVIRSLKRYIDLVKFDTHRSRLVDHATLSMFIIQFSINEKIRLKLDSSISKASEIIFQLTKF